MASGHSRKPSGRVIPRRMTKGPLDTPDDPLSLDTPSAALPVFSQQPSTQPNAEALSPSRSPTPFISKPPSDRGKDLAFLLVPSIYHPLSQLDIPPQFRTHLPAAPDEEPLQACLQQLEDLLSKGQFLSAAHYSASVLTSDKVGPTDAATIFHLLQIRYSCLELTGNTMLAAHEAKALEDLNSAFYFVSSGDDIPADGERVEEHIMPFSLRVQALRLQSLGFGDPRRGISSLYDLGLECREQIALPTASKQERDIWRRRLHDLGIRVVNALIEMGDFDVAKRALMSQTPTDGGDPQTLAQMVLLLLKIGDTTSARTLLEEKTDESENMIQALLLVCEGKWDDAVQQWESVLREPSSTDEEVMVKQNLAVALIYTGRLPEARAIMEDLINNGHGSQSLIFNLATLYELSTSNAHAKKRQLASRVAEHVGTAGQNWGRNNADFKL